MTTSGASVPASSLKTGTVDPMPWAYGRWVSRPVQSRSEQSFFKMMDAAEALLLNKSWPSLGVQEIVKHAGVSVGSFYNRFEDKAALLHCLEDRLGMDFRETLKALTAECNRCGDLLHDIDGIIVSLFMRLCKQRSGVIRALDLAQRIDACVMPDGPTGGPTPTASVDAGGFPGIGLLFDDALEGFASYLSEHDNCLEGAGSADIHRALRETFWFTRENLLYGAALAGSEMVMHRSLCQHLHASLHYPA